MCIVLGIFTKILRIFLLYNPLQGTIRLCNFALPFETRLARLKQAVALAVIGTLTVEESKEKADRPFASRVYSEGLLRKPRKWFDGPSSIAAGYT